jgi:predicted metal-dependent hydrolase
MDPGFDRAVALFNAGAFFEANEVWERLWLDCSAVLRQRSLLKR